jgi:hypothetical protein
MWTKYDPKTMTLKEGMKIKLGGHEGIIKHIDDQWEYVDFGWNTDNVCIWLARFPDLQVWVEEPKISREAAEKIKKAYRSELRAKCIEGPFLPLDALIDSMIDETK